MKDKLTPNTRIYYSGDQANSSDFGTIIETTHDRVIVKFDENEKTKSLPYSYFTEKFDGTSSQFVTYDAYKSYRNDRMQLILSKT